LYGLILDKLGIPFQVVETPAHVFLITYPNTHKIIIETTDPKNGYIKFNNGYIEKYVQYLIESKLISKTESDTSTAHNIFNRHYYKSGSLTLGTLAGAQYSNFFLYHFEDKNFELAFDEIKKSYFLNPDDRTRYLLKMAISQRINNSDYTSDKAVDDIVLLCRLHNSDSKDISSETVKHEFWRLLESQLIKNSNYSGIDLSFKKIHSALQDSSLKDDIAFHYYYELSRLAYNNFNEKEVVLKNLSEAYKINPKHADLRNLIIHYFSRLVENNHEPATVMKLMDSFTNSYPFLTENKNFNSTKANCLLQLGYQSMATNDILKGEKFLKDFEKLHINDSSIEPAQSFVEKAYSVAASVYYKKGNKAKAREFLKTGLIYAPESFALQLRLNQL
jgi:tetratricopeptide (TPR) repeat protein